MCIRDSSRPFRFLLRLDLETAAAPGLVRMAAGLRLLLLRRVLAGGAGGEAALHLLFALLALAQLRYPSGVFFLGGAPLPLDDGALVLLLLEHPVALGFPFGLFGRCFAGEPVPCGDVGAALVEALALAVMGFGEGLFLFGKLGEGGFVRSGRLGMGAAVALRDGVGCGGWLGFGGRLGFRLGRGGFRSGGALGLLAGLGLLG